MEHRRVVAARLVGGDGVGRVLRHRIDAETVGQPGHAVAMAHPHRIAPARPPHAIEQGGGREDLDVSPAEFRRMAALDLAAELLAEGLLAVADGEDRNAALEDLHGRAGTARLRNRRRAAGQDHRLGLQPRERFARLRERVDFAIDAGLAHAPRDQLRHLRAEVDDEDEVVAHAPDVAEEAGERNPASDKRAPAGEAEPTAPRPPP